ncbi:hypothetical protein [Nocardia abscessus]|uniref:hypothetical protein n=1 Tax=Nocardia abscessus TaxID=120957 RepID=UPI0024564EB6|nr:hypothetical protein [Nocardia abscessus]
MDELITQRFPLSDDLILITHAHPDHLDVPPLAALLAANPAAQLIVGDRTSEHALPAAEKPRARDHRSTGSRPRDFASDLALAMP